jgi:16S rRNA (cytosine1402-N4)-methyltransferase
VARAIVSARVEQPLVSTRQLAVLAAGAVRTRERGQDPATRTFQAVRMHINGELEEIGSALPQAVSHLCPGGRLVVISFHSLEDRIVKQFMARESRDEIDRRAPFAPPRPTRLRLLGRTRAGAAELAANPRSRSAILRVAERTDTPAAGVRA